MYQVLQHIWGIYNFQALNSDGSNSVISSTYPIDNLTTGQTYSQSLLTSWIQALVQDYNTTLNNAYVLVALHYKINGVVYTFTKEYNLKINFIDGVNPTITSNAININYLNPYSPTPKMTAKNFSGTITLYNPKDYKLVGVLTAGNDINGTTVPVTFKEISSTEVSYEIDTTVLTTEDLWNDLSGAVFQFSIECFNSAGQNVITLSDSMNFTQEVLTPILTTSQDGDPVTLTFDTTTKTITDGVSSINYQLSNVDLSSINASVSSVSASFYEVTGTSKLLNTVALSTTNSGTISQSQLTTWLSNLDYSAIYTGIVQLNVTYKINGVSYTYNTTLVLYFNWVSSDSSVPSVNKNTTTSTYYYVNPVILGDSSYTIYLTANIVNKENYTIKQVTANLPTGLEITDFQAVNDYGVTVISFNITGNSSATSSIWNELSTSKIIFSFLYLDGNGKLEKVTWNPTFTLVNLTPTITNTLSGTSNPTIVYNTASYSITSNNFNLTFSSPWNDVNFANTEMEFNEADILFQVDNQTPTLENTYDSFTTLNAQSFASWLSTLSSKYSNTTTLPCAIVVKTSYSLNNKIYTVTVDYSFNLEFFVPTKPSLSSSSSTTINYYNPQNSTPSSNTITKTITINNPDNIAFYGIGNINFSWGNGNFKVAATQGENNEYTLSITLVSHIDYWNGLNDTQLSVDFYFGNYTLSLTFTFNEEIITPTFTSSVIQYNPSSINGLLKAKILFNNPSKLVFNGGTATFSDSTLNSEAYVFLSEIGHWSDTTGFYLDVSYLGSSTTFWQSLNNQKITITIQFENMTTISGVFTFEATDSATSAISLVHTISNSESTLSTPTIQYNQAEALITSNNFDLQSEINNTIAGLSLDKVTWPLMYWINGSYQIAQTTSLNFDSSNFQSTDLVSLISQGNDLFYWSLVSNKFLFYVSYTYSINNKSLTLNSNNYDFLLNSVDGNPTSTQNIITVTQHSINLYQSTNFSNKNTFDDSIVTTLTSSMSNNSYLSQTTYDKILLDLSQNSINYLDGSYNLIITGSSIKDGNVIFGFSYSILN